MSVRSRSFWNVCQHEYFLGVRVRWLVGFKLDELKMITALRSRSILKP